MRLRGRRRRICMAIAGEYSSTPPSPDRGNFASPSRPAKQAKSFASRKIARQTNPSELPAFLRLKEVAVGFADVRARSRAGAAAQHVLIAHALAIVFAQRAMLRAVTGVGRIRTARPFPDIPEHL